MLEDGALPSNAFQSVLKFHAQSWRHLWQITRDRGIDGSFFSSLLSANWVILVFLIMQTDSIKHMKEFLSRKLCSRNFSEKYPKYWCTLNNLFGDINCEMRHLTSINDRWRITEKRYNSIPVEKNVYENINTPLNSVWGCNSVTQEQLSIGRIKRFSWHFTSDWHQETNWLSNARWYSKYR